jgi:hypothetical protein
MPPNDLTDIYKKNLVFQKIINKGKMHSYSPKLKYKSKYDFLVNQNKSYRNEISDNNLISDNNFNYPSINDKKYYNQNKKFEYINNKNDNIIKDIEFKKKLNFQLEKSAHNYYFNSNELNMKYRNNFYNNEIKLNTLNINDNINLKPLYNLEDRSIPLNTNKSFEFIMPPNDLTDIYKKNLVFQKIINQE